MTLPIPKAVLAQHTVILGKTRSGKSSTMRLLVEQILDDQKPVCIIDPKGDWWGLKSSADGRRVGYEVVIFGGRHADVPINAHSGKAVAELVATGNRPCIIDLGGWMVGERTRFFIDFAATLFTKTHGHRWLCIDEAHNFAPQGKIMDPDAGKMLHWANRLASEGAGKGVVLISASQRPQKLHKDYLTSHETLIAKRVIHPLDRGAMKDWIDGCGDPAKGKEVLDSLAGIQRSQGWVWSPEIGFGPKLIEFPMFKTYDSFAVQTGAADKKLKGWASVDLEEVKTKLAAVVEEAKANDPKELQATIFALNRSIIEQNDEIIALKKAKPSADPDALKKAKEAGFEQARKKLDATMRREVNKRIKEGLQVVRKHALEAIDRIDDELREIDGKDAELAVVIDPEIAPAPAPRIAAAPFFKRQAPPVVTPTAKPKPAAPAGDGTYTSPQLRVLRAVAFWQARGKPEPTREMVAAVAGYRHGTGNLNNIIGSLGPQSIGHLVIPRPGRLALATNGIDAPRAEEARDFMLGIFDGPERKIFEALKGAGALPRTEVAERSGYAAGTGNFNNIVGSINGTGITEIPAPGYLVLAGWAQELLDAA